MNKGGLDDGRTPSWQNKDRFTSLVVEKPYFLPTSLGLSLSAVAVNMPCYICDSVNVV